MTIPSVMQGLIEAEDGKVFELDSPKGAAWVETIGSFRFEPSSDCKAYTVRREGSGYWYGCRKVAGKVRKKYIGKSSEVSITKLEEIAAALEVPPVPRVAQEVTQVAQDRLTALELEVANLRKALEALQEALPGKLESGDSKELPKVGSEVSEELQNELSNLKAENEKVRADYDALLESSTVVTNKLREEVREVRSQLATQTEPTPQHKLYTEIEELKERNRLLLIKSRDERQALQEKIAALEYRDKSQSQRLQERQARLDELEAQLDRETADRGEVETKLADREKEISELRSQLAVEQARYEELDEEFRELDDQWSDCKKEIRQLEAELADLKQKSATASKDLPEAAEILNQLKSKRKKSKTDLADLEIILEILES
jgi:chromosome segregation ATPase